MVQQRGSVLFYVVVSKEGQDMGFVTAQPRIGTTVNLTLFDQRPILPVNYLASIICFAEMALLNMTLEPKHLRPQDSWYTSKVYHQTLTW